MALKQEWFRGLTPEQKKDLVNKIQHDPMIFDRMRVIVEQRLETESKRSRGRDQLELPNYPFSMAYQLGYEKCLEDVLKLFDK